MFLDVDSVKDFPFLGNPNLAIFWVLVVLQAVHVKVFIPSFIAVGFVVTAPLSQSCSLRQAKFILYPFAYFLAYELEFA